MRPIGSVFLAGPDRWFPDGAALIAEKAALCEAAGFAPVVSKGDGLVETERSEVMAREIFASVCQQVRGADALVANLTPWRGPNADPGTTFETGFAAALGKPVFAYLNVRDENEAEYGSRVEAIFGGTRDERGIWRDGDGCEIEDFGLAENLMLWAEARCLYVIVCQDPYEDLTGLELCLHAARMYAE